MYTDVCMYICIYMNAQCIHVWRYRRWDLTICIYTLSHTHPLPLKIRHEAVCSPHHRFKLMKKEAYSREKTKALMSKRGLH